VKILIVDEMHPSLLTMFDNEDWDFTYLPNIQREEILNLIFDYNGIVIRSKTVIDNELLEKAPKLKFIARAGAGIEKIDLNETKKREIEIFNAPEGNRDAVAEHAIGMLLALFNKIPTADKEVRQKIWKREANRGIEIKGKTFGIIGYGNMGKSFAKRLSSFECSVLAYDKYLTNYSDDFVSAVTMDEIFEEADVLSLHIPLTIESKNLIDLQFLNNFKKNIFIINTARGEILVLKDLLSALESGKVLGSCLDVLENEKLNSLSTEQDGILEKLFQSQKVIFSPHVAGWTHESYVRINEVLVEKISNWKKSNTNLF